MEEEEIVFEAEDTAPGSSGVLGNVPSADTLQYQTRSGRAVKPINEYIPTLGSAKKYEELVLYQVGKVKEPQRKSQVTGEESTCVTYDKHSALIVGIVLQQMHINKAIKSMDLRQRMQARKK